MFHAPASNVNTRWCTRQPFVLMEVENGVDRQSSRWVLFFLASLSSSYLIHQYQDPSPSPMESMLEPDHSDNSNNVNSDLESSDSDSSESTSSSASSDHDPLAVVSDIVDETISSDPEASTIGEILVMMFDWMSRHKITDEAGNDMWTFLRKILPKNNKLCTFHMV